MLYITRTFAYDNIGVLIFFRMIKMPSSTINIRMINGPIAFSNY